MICKKKAIITGINGQDGSYLAEFLLEKGYEVHGIVKRSSLEALDLRLWRIKHILPEVQLHTESLEDYAGMLKVIDEVKPDEYYHLAAQSFVNYSFEGEVSTINADINAIIYILSAIKQNASACRFYFSGSSEMFGLANKSPQNESTSFHPRSPYGVSKAASFFIAQNYRNTHNIFACNGMMFNHESSRRGFEFVTRKISTGVAKIKLGLEKELFLGNLDARRDWGYSPEFVEAMWLMLQKDKPDDYVIATGQTHSVQEFVEEAFNYAGLNWEKYVEVDKRFYRPSEIHSLCGDYGKAQKELGWVPRVGFKELVRIMVDSDIRYYTQQKTVE